MEHQGCWLSEEDMIRAQIMLEQIEGLAELLCAHLGIDHDDTALTALNVTKEKARGVFDMLTQGELAYRNGSRAAAVVGENE